MESSDHWTSEDTFSQYFHTWEGQVEYWFMWVFLGAMRRHQHKFPMFWYGAQNDMTLYLIHPSYSPFVDCPFLGQPKMSLNGWSYKDVPEDQKHLVGEDFLPILKRG